MSEIIDYEVDERKKMLQKILTRRNTEVYFFHLRHFIYRVDIFVTFDR